MNATGASEIIQLRRLLSERFPGVRSWPEQGGPSPVLWPSGLAQLDLLLQGGFSKGAMTEIAGGPGTGSGLLLRALLRQTDATGQLMGLIDGQDSFDPGGIESSVLSRLFWVRCRTAEEALKATDILLRDRNLPLIALDLKMNPAAQLRKIAGTTWYRWQRIVRQTGAAFVVLTPQALVAGVEARLLLESRWTPGAWPETEETLLAGLKFDLARSASGALENIPAAAG